MIASKQKLNTKEEEIGCKNYMTLLLDIPQAKISIYTDCIIAHRPFDLKIDKTGQIKTQVTQSNIQQPNKEDKTDLQRSFSSRNFLKIMFNNPDFAFNVQQNQKNVQIHNLSNHTIELKFQVNTLQTLFTVQSLFRKKLCQLGFQNRYKFVKQLGKGATAQVHLVERVGDKKLFAAKIISIKQANDKSYETFINESKLLRMMNHKNIVHLQSLYIHKKQLIQVLQYFDGGTLLQSVKNDQIRDKKQRWKVLHDIIQGLDYLRQRSVVHRDIKMQNILIRKKGKDIQYVISDFGLACWIRQKKPLFERCGTPGYIAPQILNAPKGKPILNHKTDIFSLGAIAHILFLRQPLFPYTGNIKQLLKQNKKANYAFSSYLYDDLSVSQMGFLEFSLAKDPKDRKQANQIIEQIRYLSNQLYQITPIKSAKGKRIAQEIKLSKEKCGVQVQVKKQTSLIKRKLNLSSSSLDKQYNREDENKKPNSARKFISDIWAQFTSPRVNNRQLKIKENSVQKHKKLTEYFNE